MAFMHNQKFAFSVVFSTFLKMCILYVKIVLKTLFDLCKKLLVEEIVLRIAFPL